MHGRFSVHPVNRSRHVHGEYHHLIPVLLDDPFKFAEYLRMNPYTFSLDECSKDVTKQSSSNCVVEYSVVQVVQCGIGQ